MRELLDVICDNVNHHDVYFNNFFTSLPLLEELQTQGICATIVRANKLLGVPFPLLKEMQKKERRAMEVCSTSNVCIVQ